MSKGNKTIPVEAGLPIEEDDTMPTRVIPPPKKARRGHDVEEAVDIATEVDVLRGADLGSLSTPAKASKPPKPARDPATAARRRSESSPILALAKPRPGHTAGFAERALRLPTEREIREAIEGTPTDAVPVVTRGTIEEEISIDDLDEP